MSENKTNDSVHPSAGTLKRFSFFAYGGFERIESESGAYVEHSDAIAAIEAAERRGRAKGIEEAAQVCERRFNQWKSMPGGNGVYPGEECKMRLSEAWACMIIIRGALIIQPVDDSKPKSRARQMEDAGYKKRPSYRDIPDEPEYPEEQP